MAEVQKFEIKVDETEYVEFRDRALRPVWNGAERKCNADYCNFKASSFEDYIKHWRRIHNENTVVHICSICDRRFGSHSSVKRHIGYIHKRSKPVLLIRKETVKNFSFRDPGDNLPYRKGTLEERQLVREQQREKEANDRKRLAEKCREDSHCRTVNLFEI